MAEPAGIFPEEAEALRERVPGGRDLLAMGDLGVANMLMRNADARVAGNTAYRQEKGRKKVARMVETLAQRLDGITGAERAELLAALRESTKQ